MNIEQKIVELVPHDKCLHFIVGVLVYMTAGHFLADQALYLVVAVAALKEAYDIKAKSDASGSDVIATLAGGIVGYVCSLG